MPCSDETSTEWSGLRSQWGWEAGSGVEKEPINGRVKNFSEEPSVKSQQEGSESLDGALFLVCNKCLLQEDFVTTFVNSLPILP